METQTAAYWIKRLDLRRHPEGGYYKEIFRSQQQVMRVGARKVRQAVTSIYYLLEGSDFSGFHRIASDELWYFHKGSPLLIHVINEKGIHTAFELSDTLSGSLSIAVKAGLWFAVEVPANDGSTLVSCAVAPGFEFGEFEMAQKEEMVILYPQHAGLLDKFCRL
jgi:predicted cupin superfamily sugar epimerase